jgi:hypothetical protein
MNEKENLTIKVPKGLALFVCEGEEETVYRISNSTHRTGSRWNTRHARHRGLLAGAGLGFGPLLRVLSQSTTCGDRN